MTDPKYQWSKFAGPDRNEQYVVREDDFETFKKAKANIESLLGSSSTPVEPKEETIPFPAHTEEEDTDTDTKMCLEHDEPMSQKYSKAKGKTYWAHWNGAGKPCFGFGYQS